jgi:hypothetical protein
MQSGKIHPARGSERETGIKPKAPEYALQMDLLFSFDT